MASPRQQFNVTLPRELVRRVKHHAIDVQLSLSDLVAHALYQQLSTEEKTMNQPGDHDPGMRLRPMVHVEEMAASVAFYEQLGGEIVHGSRDGDWVLLCVAGARIGLLAHPPNPEQNEGTVELNFEATEPLEQLEERLRAAGVQIARPTNDEGFGRQLQLASPDGLLLKIDELEPELYS
jgi:post-segregation antitoxin (ccd killing protein)/uncharacterized glyoxalase superfamily protein PhnB